MGYTVDTDAVRASGARVLTSSETISSESLSLAATIEALVNGDGFNSSGGRALLDSVQLLRTNVAQLSLAMSGLSSNMGTAAANYDSSDSSAVAALRI